jgi:hypothetical protein
MVRQRADTTALIPYPARDDGIETKAKHAAALLVLTRRPLFFALVPMFPAKRR